MFEGWCTCALPFQNHPLTSPLEGISQGYKWKDPAVRILRRALGDALKLYFPPRIFRLFSGDRSCSSSCSCVNQVASGILPYFSSFNGSVIQNLCSSSFCSLSRIYSMIDHPLVLRYRHHLMEICKPLWKHVVVHDKFWCIDPALLRCLMEMVLYLN